MINKTKFLGISILAVLVFCQMGCSKKINQNYTAKIESNKHINYVELDNKNTLFHVNAVRIKERRDKEIAEYNKQLSTQSATSESTSTNNTVKKSDTKSSIQSNTSKQAGAANNSSNLNNNNKSDKAIPNQLLIDKIRGKGSAQQAIVVTSSGYKTISVTINCFDKQGGSWRQVFSIPGVIGINGFSDNRHEGDLTTPTGIYSLGTGFGKYGNPGTAMSYRKTSSNDIWADDNAHYNTWVTDPSISGEHLLRDDWLYDYAFVVNFNTNPVTIGRGSGIFFHCWRSPSNGTAGCIAAEESNVKNILQWLNPSKSPVIIEGPLSEVLNM